MDTLFVKVAGLDVHLKVIQVAVRCRQESGKLFKQVRSFGTMTRDLRALADYLQALGVASWCGMCPGNEESGGRRLRSRTRKGNRWLRRALVEAAWGASRVKNSYLRAQFRRLAPRRGNNRALVAVAHSLLVIIYHVLKYNVEYRDLGPDYFDRLEPERLRRYLVKRLESLGYDVTLSDKNPDDNAA
jgi:hypothetical protein